MRIEHLAVLVFARVAADASTAAVLIKQVCREADPVANPPADHIAHRLAHGFADEIETGDFDRGERAGVAVERILAGHEVGLGASAGRFRGLPGGLGG